MPLIEKKISLTSHRFLRGVRNSRALYRFLYLQLNNPPSQQFRRAVGGGKREDYGKTKETSDLQRGLPLESK